MLDWIVAALIVFVVGGLILGRFVPPIPPRDKLRDGQRVRRYARWLVRRDNLARPVANPSSYFMFAQGLRPNIPVGVHLDSPDGGDTDCDFRMIGLTGQLFGADDLKERTSDPIEWFTTKLALDLYVLDGRDRAGWELFLDRLLAAGNETLMASFQVSNRLGIDPRDWKSVLSTLDDESERIAFLGNLVTDNFIGAEARALARCHYSYFGEYYVPAHARTKVVAQ